MFKLVCATSIGGGFSMPSHRFSFLVSVLMTKMGREDVDSSLKLAGVKALEVSEVSGSRDCRGFSFSVFFWTILLEERLRASNGAARKLSELCSHRR
eukprot:3136376-Pyramimonas_sp.AAC.1